MAADHVQRSESETMKQIPFRIIGADSRKRCSQAVENNSPAEWPTEEVRPEEAGRGCGSMTGALPPLVSRTP